MHTQTHTKNAHKKMRTKTRTKNAHKKHIHLHIHTHVCAEIIHTQTRYKILYTTTTRQQVHSSAQQRTQQTHRRTNIHARKIKYQHESDY